MSPLYILGGVEAVLIGATLARLRAALRPTPYSRTNKRRSGPILLPELRPDGIEDRDARSSRP